jgi:hypothetical protein
MTSGSVNRSLLQGIGLKVGLPLLIGLITLIAAHFGGMEAHNSLELAAIVAFGVALVLFMVDTEIRILAVVERVTTGFEETEMRISAVGDRVAAGVAAGHTEIGRLAELSGMMERSSLGPTPLADFLKTASRVDGRVNPLLQRLAQREVERVALFLRQLPDGIEINYDGEDRDWMLGLTREAQISIDAISLSTVDAGVLGLDGGLWTSDLGQRYLELQREAVIRDVRIRRIFVVEQEHEEMVQDESFLRITQVQRDIGVEVRMLDHKLIPDWMRSMIFDFIVFDGAVSYETTPATSFTSGQMRPGKLRTRMAPEPARVRELEERFGQLWVQADPERQIDE